MIKLPEPANQSLAEDIAALDCRYRGSPSYEHDAAYMRKAAEDLVLKGYAIYTESQLKQAVRDALNLAADTCESTLYVEGDGTVSVFGPKTDANVEIRKCRDAIRALIKEIV